MEQAKIGRINELAHLAKERALTEQELTERDILRKEYIAAYRAAVQAQLNNIIIEEPDGTRHKPGIHPRKTD